MITCLRWAWFFSVLCWLGAVLQHAPAKESPVLIEDGQAIAFLGDSITHSGETYGNFCRLVLHGVKAQGIQATGVFAGVSGNTSRDMLARLERDVLSRKPDWLILAAGVNDIWHGDPTVKIGVFQPEPGMGVKLPEYKENITAIVDRCQQANVKVMLTTITPIREDPDFHLNHTAKEYNAFLEQLAAERNLPLARLREAMFAEIAKGTRLTSDGVHPIQSGQRVMAMGILRGLGLTDTAISALATEWEASPTLLILGDRQVTSGGRPGGWCHLLMDGLNNGREMVTFSSIAHYRPQPTLEKLLAQCNKRFSNSDGESRRTPRWAILVGSLSDVDAATTVQDYQQQVMAFLTFARAQKIQPVLVTIPVQEDAPNGERSQACAPYNAVLRDVAQQEQIPIADIHAAMVAQLTGDTPTKLTYDGERLNRQGSILMATMILEALSFEEALTPALQKTWRERSFYAE